MDEGELDELMKKYGISTAMKNSIKASEPYEPFPIKNEK
jgi:hypothetical protein